jgi:hypothetical protein
VLASIVLPLVPQVFVLLELFWTVPLVLVHLMAIVVGDVAGYAVKVELTLAGCPLAPEM